MAKRNELLSEIIHDELSRYNFMYSYEEKQMIKNANFKEVANKQLKKIKNYFWLVVVLILIFSGWGIYQFIVFGNTENALSLILGLCMWGFAISLTYLFTKEIVAKRKSMKMILQLLKKQ
jgi:hypothetical protein